jgi:asparagine synthase (glutamine-hydrolysing)
MTNISISVTGKPTGKLSPQALNYFLRWGFLPTPLHLDSGLSAVNTYSDFDDDYSTPGLTRNLQQFAGNRVGKNTDVKFAINIFSKLLCQEVEKSTKDAHHIYLMASGGKDSLSIAWALRAIGKKATLVHCRDFVRDDESCATKQAAADLGHSYIEIDTNIFKLEELLKNRINSISMPIADPAFFPYLMSISKIEELHRPYHNNGEIAVVLDGMGNDAYMGHIPGLREKRLLRLPTIRFRESFIRSFYSNNIVHYGLEILSRHSYERHFSGVGFSNGINDHGSLDDIFKIYSDTPEYRRALVRGAVFDLDCCIRKGVIATEISSSLKISYPYLSSNFRNFFDGLDSSIKFDYNAGINKLILRQFLKEKNITSEFSSSKKGSFRCDLSRLSDVYKTSNELKEILRISGFSMNAINRLHHQSSLNFVAAQKLSILYILDRYIISKKLNAIDYEVSPTPIRYCVSNHA